MTTPLQSATPLPPTARPARALLRVADLDRSLAFYRDRLGLVVTRLDGRTATLSTGSVDDTGADVGAPGAELLVLREVAGVARRPHRPRTAGLYHVALLVPSRGALGRAIEGLSAEGYPLSGASDHAVSESLYLDDPDGNGLEIYADRPRSEWREGPDGVFMTTEALDIDAVLAAGRALPGPWRGLPNETVVGHVHFTVADVARAERFYRDVVGLDVRARFPTLVAVAAGGYHHHVNLNAWAGSRAPADSPDVAGLDAWELAVDAGARDALAARLESAGALVERGGDGRLVALDPDGIPLHVPALVG